VRCVWVPWGRRACVWGMPVVIQVREYHVQLTLQDGDCAFTALTRFDVPTKSVFSGPLPSFHLALGNAVVPVHDTTASMPSHIPDAVSAAASRRSAVHSSRSSLAPKSCRADSGLRDVARTT